MAANTRTFSPPASLNQIATVANFNKLDTNGAEAINRNSTASGSRAMPLKPVEMIDSAGGGLGTRMGYCLQGHVVTYNVAYDLWIPLEELPHDHVLNTVSMVVMPAGAHGAQPAVLPSIHVYSVTTAGVTALLGSGTYVWSDIPTYEAGFTLTTAALAATIDRTKTYWVKVILESGANSVTGLALNGMTAAVTVDPSLGGPDFTHWL